MCPRFGTGMDAETPASGTYEIGMEGRSDRLRGTGVAVMQHTGAAAERRKTTIDGGVARDVDGKEDFPGGVC